MGGKFQQQAELGSKYFEAHLGMIQEAFRLPPPPNSRTVIIGDSTLRQVFTSIACLSSPFLAESKVDWIPHHACRRKANNCIDGGVHGKFNVGSLVYENGHEIHYLPHSGASKAQTEGDIFARMRGDLAVDGGVSLGGHTAIETRGSEQLWAGDVIVASVGVHDESVEMNLSGLSSLGRALLQLPDRPRLIFVASSTQHFASVDGTWERCPQKPCSCQPGLRRSIREDREATIFRPGMNVDEVLTWEDTDLGEYNIGNGDCTHYCMPGVPDVLAARLFQRVRGS